MNNKILFSTITTCIFGLGLGMTSAASAAPVAVSSYQIRGDGMSVSSLFREGECTSGGFDFAANTDVLHGGGQPVTSTVGWVGFWYYDGCTGEFASGYTEMLDTDLVIQAGYAHAQVEADVELFGWRQTPDGGWDEVYLGTKRLSASVDLTAIGQAFHGRSSWMSRWGKTMFRSRWIGSTSEAAVAVSGTLDGVPLVFEYSYGSFGSYHSGSTDIHHY